MFRYTRLTASAVLNIVGFLLILLATADAQSTEPVIIVGAGLAGLTAAYEITKAGGRVIIVDQENSNNLGGQAFWSLGGMYLVNSDLQGLAGVKDSLDLARRDWFNSAQFDRLANAADQDYWASQWANAYLNFSAGGMADYIEPLGWSSVPTLGWAERGAGLASGHGNSVPRFHLTWGTGPGVVELFTKPLSAAPLNGLIQYRWRSRVDEIIKDASGRAIGVRGSTLRADTSPRGVASNRDVVGTFEITGRAVLVTTGGIGGNTALVKQFWPVERLGGIPETVVTGVPAHVDGRMLAIAETAGARLVNRDRMWHYTEGLKNFNPIWPNHGIRVIPGPSSLWLDATGKRLPAPAFPGADTIATLREILSAGYDYSWFILDQTIIDKEFVLSGSEQNPDLTSKSWIQVLQRLTSGSQPIKDFQAKGEDFVVANNINDLVNGMNAKRRGGAPLLTAAQIEKVVSDRDAQLDNSFTKDAQIMLIRNALNFIGDRIIRTTSLHKILDPANGPLLAIRMNILTRKTLGGIQTNLDSQVLRPDGTVFPGLYSAGEVAGFGGGGVHGYNALEGTFLTGCIFSGRAAGLALARGS